MVVLRRRCCLFVSVCWLVPLPARLLVKLQIISPEFFGKFMPWNKEQSTRFCRWSTTVMLWFELSVRFLASVKWMPFHNISSMATVNLKNILCTDTCNFLQSKTAAPLLHSVIYEHVCHVGADWLTIIATALSVITDETTMRTHFVISKCSPTLTQYCI